MKGLRFDFCQFRPCYIPINDKRAEKFARKVANEVFESISYAPYEDFTGGISITIFGEGSPEQSYFETEFTRNTNNVVGDYNLDNTPKDDVLEITFDVVDVDFDDIYVKALSGLIRVSLYFVQPDGKPDWGMSRTTYRAISKEVKLVIRESDFAYNFATNYNAL